ncbi:hypothetical protein [Nocardia sp. A7]|uniref:hypothetical protein n=1 Tax=Nocardia sp. A7 TaxID=2789274 RepID=UPI003979091E
MKTKCGRVPCKVRGPATLCQRCARDLVERLQSIPGLVADVIIMRSGEQRLGAPDTPRVHLTATPRIPVQLMPRNGAPALRGDRELTGLRDAVIDTTQRLAAALGVAGAPVGHGLAQLVLNNRGYTRAGTDLLRLDSTPATPMEMAAIWCACHLKDLRNHPDAAVIYRRISNAVSRVEAAIDPERRRYLGPCPTEVGDAGQTCGARLLAAPDRATVRCTRCHTSYVVADLEADAMRRAEDGLWTAAELLEHVLPSIGHHIPRSTLYWWTRKRVVPPRGHMSSDGRITDHQRWPGDPEVYRLGDVLAAAARDTNPTPRKANP